MEPIYILPSPAMRLDAETIRCDCGQRVPVEDSYVCHHRTDGHQCGRVLCLDCNKDELSWELEVCPSCMPSFIRNERELSSLYANTLRRLSVESGEDWVRHVAKQALHGERAK